MFKLTKTKNWLIYSIINPNIKERLKKYACGKLLDLGCGDKAYQDMASPYVDMHIGIDHIACFHDHSNIDCFCLASELPFKSNSFDSILCTDVMEHLEYPDCTLAEALRVMKPGGYAIFTTPLFWHIHEGPYDFFRYTCYGLETLFKRNGFDVVDITPLSGFIVTFAQLLVYFLYYFRKGGPINPLWWIIPPVGVVIQAVAYVLNKIDPTTDFTVEYISVVRKPEEK